MRKLKLDIDELKVESFTTAPLASPGGTVHGRVGDPVTITLPPDDTEVDCHSVGTCVGPTYCCDATWKPSCADTCINTQCAGDTCGYFCTWNDFQNTCGSCVHTTCYVDSLCPGCPI